MKKLSVNVKGRDEYVPVAPMMLIETARKFYELKDNIFVLLLYVSNIQLNNFKDFKYSGIVHYDNTSRIQICNDDTLIEILSNSIKN